jgi:hypothetical protein
VIYASHPNVELNHPRVPSQVPINTARVLAVTALLVMTSACGSTTAPGSAQSTPAAVASATPARAESSALPELFAGLSYSMELPGWLGGGATRWNAQLEILTVSGAAPDKLAILKGFDAPIVGHRFFAIDISTDLAVYVDSNELPGTVSDEEFLTAAEQAMVALAEQDGQIAVKPIQDRVTSPLGGPGGRIRYVTHSVDVAGSKFDEARIAFLFRGDGVGYLLLFTFPVIDDRYDEVDRIVATFRQK